MSRLLEFPITEAVNRSESYRCSHDQWDIYCLDPHYECRIRKAPHPWKIIRVESSEKNNQFTFAAPSSPKSTSVNLKRPFVSSPRIRRESDDESTVNSQKKLRSVSISDEAGASSPRTEDSDRMHVDDELHGKRHLRSERLRKVRANIEEARRLRREWNSKWKNKLNEIAITEMVLDEDYDMVDAEKDAPEVAFTAKRKGRRDHTI